MPPNPACQIAAAALLTQAKYIFGRNFVKNASLFSKTRRRHHGSGRHTFCAGRPKTNGDVKRDRRVGQRNCYVKAEIKPLTLTLSRGRAVSIPLSSPGTPVL